MRVLVTGATGYIGGSVAVGLVADGHVVEGLVRSEERAASLRSFGIAPVIGSLDDAEGLAAAAGRVDAVVHCADADHWGSVVTLVTALQGSGKTLIHTTGSAIVADGADGEPPTRPPLGEDDPFEPVPFRRARVDMIRYVRAAALDRAVRTIVICPTMIYGTGRGPKLDSDQIPKLVALSKSIGAGVYFGRGLNRYSNVHIDDLVDLYRLALERAPGGTFLFAENGDASFADIAEMIRRGEGLGANAGLPVSEVAARYGEAGRLGVASNSLVRSVNARRLGWHPSAPALADWFACLKR